MAEMMRALPLLALLTWSPALAAQQIEAPAPHIVMFLADDLGWGDVGYHGSGIGTPHIDALARRGVRLEQHYAQPVCSRPAARR
jgi:arylsulfatase A-like enzyme